MPACTWVSHVGSTQECGSQQQWTWIINIVLTIGNSYCLLCARPAYLSTVVRTGKHPAQRRHCCFVFATALLEAISPSGARRQTFKEVDTLLKITWFLSGFKLKAVQSLNLFLPRERDHGILFFYQQCRLDDKKWKKGNQNHPRLYHMAAQFSVFLSSLCFCVFWLNFVCTQPLSGHQWRLLQTHWRTLGLKTCQSQPGSFTTWGST